MFKHILTAGLLAGSSLIFVSNVQAEIVTWTLQNVVLSDGQTVEGSFEIDTFTRQYLNISITNSGSTLIPQQDFTYHSFGGGGSAVGFRLVATQDNAPETDDLALNIVFDSYLLSFSVAETVAIDTDQAFWFCAQDGCESISAHTTSPTADINILSGVVTTSPVPIPAAAWLFGSALMGVVGLRHKQKCTVS
ncbi:MAG: VPLPA-CTERM sorting domain-containing protein [Pseudomonadales bacterium]